ncbi:MAG: hypothetical protein D3903_11515 [Candidatus Electrothrix sp. GM3_4]|nr:hypothetical protein [Candidatus Electrothrix sp. GM3_4]
MEKHNTFEKLELEILLGMVTKIEKCLLLSGNLQNWLKKQNAADKAMLSDKFFEVSIYRAKLQNDLLEILVDEFNELAQPLGDGIKELLEEIEKTESFIKAMDTLSKVLGLVSRVVTLAA